MTYRDSEKLAPLVQEMDVNNNIIIMEKCKDDLERVYIQMSKIIWLDQTYFIKFY